MRRLARRPPSQTRRGSAEDGEPDAGATDRRAPVDCIRCPDHTRGHPLLVGPDSGPVLVAETDVRVGGRFRVRFRTLDGGEHESLGQYLEVRRPERLVLSWRWLDGIED